MKAKRIIPLVILTIIGILIGGVVATLYWSSPIFQKTITTTGVFTAYCNVVDPKAMFINTADKWDYSQLVTTDNLLSGNKIRIFVNMYTQTTGSDSAYMKILASGNFMTSGGDVSATIKVFTITNDDTISQIGSTITIPDVSTMSSTLVPGMLTKGVSVPYVEVVLTFIDPGDGWNDYTCDIQVYLGDLAL